MGINNLELTQNFLRENDSFLKQKTHDKAFAQFTDEGGEVREGAFKMYFHQFKDGIRDVHEIKVAKTSAKAPTLTLDEISLSPYRTDDKRNKIDDSVFMPFETGKMIDTLFSQVTFEEVENPKAKKNARITVKVIRRGIMQGTATIITGGPGVGKTTVCYDTYAALKRNYPNAKIGFINSEMKKLDIQFERRDKEYVKDIDFILLSEFGYENIMLVLLKVFTSGYDILFIDSIQDIIDKIKDFCDKSEGEAENFILGLLENAMEAKDNEDKHTAIIAIQQVTKGGVFKGSNKLKHSTTGMLHLEFDDYGMRYAEFSKNRRGGMHINKKLFYGLNDKSEVEWNEVAWKEAEQTRADLKKTKDAVTNKSEGFDTFFRTNELGTQPVVAASHQEEEEDDNED